MSQRLDELRAAGASLEEIVKEKFKRLSMQELLSRIYRAPDFGWDDEGVELSRRCDERGEGWRFAGEKRIEFYRKADALRLDIRMGGFAGLVWGDVLTPEEGRRDAADHLRRGYITQGQHDDALRRIEDWARTREGVAT